MEEGVNWKVVGSPEKHSVEGVACMRACGISVRPDTEMSAHAHKQEIISLIETFKVFR